MILENTTTYNTQFNKTMHDYSVTVETKNPPSSSLVLTYFFDAQFGNMFPERSDSNV